MNRRVAHPAALFVFFSWLWISPLHSLAQLLPPLPGGSLIVTITSPSSGSTVSATIPVNANVSIIGSLTVADVEFYVDDNSIGSDNSAPYSVSWNTKTVGNGSHTLTAVARDLLGVRFTSDPVMVTVSNAPPPDTAPPMVSIASPANGSTVSGTSSVTANASDDRGVVGVRFILDGADLGAEDALAPYAVTWDTTTVPDGPHTLTAVARDAAGNRTTSLGVTVGVANAPEPPPPTVTRFEETDPAAIFAGPWVPRRTETATFSGGSALSSNVAGATATFTFTGTAVSWVGLRCNICGIASVSIDGGAPSSVNTAGAAAPGGSGLASEVVFTASGLAAGATHTLVITVTGMTTSDGTHIGVDAFDVTGAGSGSPPAAGRIQETDPAVRYTGSWALITDPRVSGGAYMESIEAGARATLTFTGTAVSWISARAPVTGIARVFLDGALMGEVDTYHPSEEGQVVVFTAAGLPPGAHTLTIEVTGTNNPASEALWIVVDAFDVTP